MNEGVMGLALALGCLLAAAAAGVPAGAAPAPRTEQRKAFDGGDIVYQGGFYHYRAGDGIALLSMWVPPDAKPVRGLFLNGNPGGYGDNRRFTRDRTFQAFAARFGFGLAGVASMPAREVNPRLAGVILSVLNDCAAMGRHPELAHVPFITLGNSNGGATSYSFANFAPERTLCFVMNVGRFTGPPSDGLLRVPGFIVIGPVDPLVGPKDPAERPAYVAGVRAFVADARRKGARWAWLAEQNKGHEVGRIFDYYMLFFEHCIRARLPELRSPQGDPRKGPVKLRDLPLESGWLADDTAWESGLTPIAPYADYAGDRSVASWLPDADLAHLYRGLATYDNPVKLSFPGLGEIRNANASGVFLTEVGGHLVEPGAKVTLEADLSAMPEWRTVEFHRGATKLGAVARPAAGGSRATLEVTADPRRAACSFTALARDALGSVRTATPVHFVVRNPRNPLPVLPEPLARRPGAARSAANGSADRDAPADASRFPVDPTDGVLVAYALGPEQEKQFAGRDGELSPFWAAMGERHDRIEMTPRGEAGKPCLVVKAARGSAGLYLCFEASAEAWPEAGTGVDLAGRHAVDFFLDNRSADRIWEPPLSGTFTHVSAALTLTTVQFQAPFGGSRPPTHLQFSFAFPFEFRGFVVTREELRSARGIRFGVKTLAPGRKAMEWLIPWAEVGRGGLPGEPRLGERIAFAGGMNLDVFGTDTPAGKVRWRGNTDPWNIEWRRGRQEAWGDILMGPGMETSR